MSWKQVQSQDDADELLGIFGGFHDSCIREAYVFTDHWVSENLSMSCPGHLDNRVRLLVQRQYRNLSAIEMLFESVTHFNLVPSGENRDSIIFSAALVVRGGLVCWCPDANWVPDKPRSETHTWIAAKSMRWREADGLLGEGPFYGPKDEGSP